MFIYGKHSWVSNNRRCLAGLSLAVLVFLVPSPGVSLCQIPVREAPQWHLWSWFVYVCRNQSRSHRGTPELLGVVLLDLCPLLHKLYVTLHQVEARLRVFLDDVILVLKQEQHRGTVIVMLCIWHETLRLSPTVVTSADSFLCAQYNNAA